MKKNWYNNRLSRLNSVFTELVEILLSDYKPKICWTLCQLQHAQVNALAKVATDIIDKVFAQKKILLWVEITLIGLSALRSIADTIY